SHNWIQIQLVGRSFNRDGVGAKVTVESGDLVQTAEVHSGRSYQSHYASRLYFGLGKRTTVDRVRVDWLGKSSSHSDLLINRNHTLREP
ncbi:MAG: ASPIC/UnbV domain-containing protein, partial [Aureliella sp.]